MILALLFRRLYLLGTSALDRTTTEGFIIKASSSTLGSFWSTAASLVLVLAADQSTAFATCSGTSPNIICTRNVEAFSFNTSGPAAIPRTATPYPSSNVVSGLTGTLSSSTSAVRVRLNNFIMDWVGDLHMLLLSPAGTPYIFWSSIGPTGQAQNVSGLVMTVSDAATADLPTLTAPVSGTFRPKNYSTLVVQKVAAGA